MHGLKGGFRNFALPAVLFCGLCACDGHDRPMQLGEERAGTKYNVTLKGGGNQGHEFGTTLSREEKDALLEYPKTL